MILWLLKCPQRERVFLCTLIAVNCNYMFMLYQFNWNYSNFCYHFLIFSYHGTICAGAGQGVWHFIVVSVLSVLSVQFLVSVKHRLQSERKRQTSDCRLNGESISQWTKRPCFREFDSAVSLIFKHTACSGLSLGANTRNMWLLWLSACLMSPWC